MFRAIQQRLLFSLAFFLNTTCLCIVVSHLKQWRRWVNNARVPSTDRIPSKSEASPSINCTRSRTPMLTPTVAPPLRFRKGKSRSKKRVDFHGSFVYLLLLSLQFSFFCRFLQYPVQYSDIVVRVFRWKISLVSVMFLFFRVVPPTFATGEIVKCEFLFQRERVNF